MLHAPEGLRELEAECGGCLWGHCKGAEGADRTWHWHWHYSTRLLQYSFSESDSDFDPLPCGVGLSRISLRHKSSYVPVCFSAFQVSQYSIVTLSQSPSSTCFSWHNLRDCRIMTRLFGVTLQYPPFRSLALKSTVIFCSCKVISI